MRIQQFTVHNSLITMKKILIIIALALTASHAWAQKAEPAENAETRGYAVAIGDDTPDFTITYLDGKTVKLSSLRGKLVMLQFTASWCPVCRKEMPHIENDIWQRHKTDTNFVLIGIDLKEKPRKITQFAKETGISYPLTLDENGKIFALYTEKNAGVTRNILIAPNGKILFMTRLFDPEEFNMLVQIIEDELKNIK